MPSLFFFSSRRRHTRYWRDWSSDVCSSDLSLAGLAFYILGPATPFAFAGVLLWGLGASLGFPVGMSAAADDPAHAASRASVVASIRHCAFLGGPPLIGFLGDHITVRNGVVAVAGLPIGSVAPASAVYA